ncbi:hypothetical protein [Methanobrevibacter sp.]|nr:hypothetical protein [Methanobrevibacter sp.]
MFVKNIVATESDSFKTTTDKRQYLYGELTTKQESGFVMTIN